MYELPPLGIYYPGPYVLTFREVFSLILQKNLSKIPIVKLLNVFGGQDALAYRLYSNIILNMMLYVCFCTFSGMILFQSMYQSDQIKRLFLTNRTR